MHLHIQYKRHFPVDSLFQKRGRRCLDLYGNGSDHSDNLASKYITCWLWAAPPSHL